MKEAVKGTRPSVVIGIGITLMAWLCLLGSSVIKTIYDDHVSLVATIGQLNAQKKRITEDANKRVADLEAKLKAKPKGLVETLGTRDTLEVKITRAVTPILHAINSDKEGFIKTEIILVPKAKMPPPVEAEMEFDFPIFGIGQVTVADSGVVLTGGSRWNGTKVFASVRSPGITPEHAMIVQVYSRQRVHLAKPPLVH